MPPELGFDRARLPDRFVPTASKSESWDNVRLAADAWTFYRFEITDDDYQVQVTMERDEDEGGTARLFLRHETLPTLDGAITTSRTTSSPARARRRRCS